MGMPDDDAIRAIAEAARANRKRPSRALWIAAALVGIGATIAFVVLMFADGSSAPPKPTSPNEHGTGFTIGLVIGGAVGIAIGYSIARHSSRKRP
jgi:uncharacterized membrane protein YsdA (DUF1294 family)